MFDVAVALLVVFAIGFLVWCVYGLVKAVSALRHAPTAALRTAAIASATILSVRLALVLVLYLLIIRMVLSGSFG